MENLLLTYNIALTVLFSIAFTVFYLFYMKSKDKLFLYSSFLFLLIIIDNTMIYLSEFSYSYADLFETNDFIYFASFLIYLVIFIDIRLITTRLFKEQITDREKYIYILVAILLVALLKYIPFQISECIVFICYYLSFIYLSISLYKKYVDSVDDYD